MSRRQLDGYGVLVTRPAHLADELQSAIAAAGGIPHLFPAIDVLPRDRESLQDDLVAIPRPDLIVYVSRNAVAHGHDELPNDDAIIVAIGPATQTALEAAGSQVDVIPESGFDTEHLLLHPALQQVDGRHVLIVRGDKGRELLGDTLRERGATVDYLSVYSRESHAASNDELALLEDAWNGGQIDCVTAMSVGTLESLLEILPAGCREALSATLLVTPSARVIQTAQKLVPGIRTALAPGPQAADMVRALIACRQSG